MNKNYKNGRAREYRIIKKLEKEGWLCIRSAGSHSPIDIIAMMPINKYIDISEKKAEKDLSKAQDEATKLSIVSLNANIPTDYLMSLNSNIPVGFEEYTVIRFIQSKKTGYLTPQERKEKKKLEQRLGIIIEIM